MSHLGGRIAIVNKFLSRFSFEDSGNPVSKQAAFSSTFLTFQHKVGHIFQFYDDAL